MADVSIESVNKMYEDISLITAIITPFTNDNTIDYPALDSLTERLIAEGTQGFVIGGTTGESPTLKIGRAHV